MTPNHAISAEAVLTHKQRTQARTLAMQALCLYDALGDDFAKQLNEFLRDEENLGDLGIELPLPPPVLTLARALAESAWNAHTANDELVGGQLADWSLARLARVERGVIRLALYELRERPETAPAIVLNDAIEIAKRFGGNESAAFVNGVLDHLRKRLADQAPAADSNAASPAPEPSPEGSDGAV